MVAFSAYYDDSGTHLQSEYVAVGGAIASNDSWVELCPKWADKLHDNGVEVFHATDCSLGLGEYAEWDNEKKKNLFCNLLEIIQQANCRFTAIVCNRQDFDKLIIEIPQHDRLDIYQFCLEMCVAATADWADKQENIDPIATFIENKDGTTNYFLDSWLKKVKDKSWQQTNKISMIAFLGKGDCVPLQVADLVAYESYRLLDNVGKRELRKSMKSLLPYFLDQHGYCMGEGLKAALVNRRDVADSLIR